MHDILGTLKRGERVTHAMLNILKLGRAMHDILRTLKRGERVTHAMLKRNNNGSMTTLFTTQTCKMSRVKTKLRANKC